MLHLLRQEFLVRAVVVHRAVDPREVANLELSPETEVAGRIVRFVVDNEAPVEPGQTLALIETA